MSFELRWTRGATVEYQRLRDAAAKAQAGRRSRAKAKSSKQEGLFKQLHKAVELLRENPRPPGLQTHEFASVTNPADPTAKVFEAYVQNRTPGAYRIFWCYGPAIGELTILAITPHP